MSEAPKGPLLYADLRSARREESAVVYGLALDNAIFYVGKTVTASKRFAAHAQARTSNKRLKKILSANADAVQVIILERSPRDINQAERDWIRRTPNIVNLVTADSDVWGLHSEVPWAAGSGVHCPSVWLALRASKNTRAQTKQKTKVMTDGERCVYEASLFLSLPDEGRASLAKWYRATREKMICCIERWYGEDCIMVHAS